MFDFSAAGIAFMLIRVPVILLALTIHEFAHAWTAWKLGDPTAHYQGRVSLNPIRHLDPLGTLCLLFAPIGWAKPVPVNPYNFRNPGRDDILVSAAGPMSNLLQAIIFALLLVLPWGQWADSLGSAVPQYGRDGGVYWTINSLMQAQGAQKLVLIVWAMASMGLLLNVGLMVFNLLPFFPLDGHHIARENLRGEARMRFIEFQRYGPFMIFGLIILDNMLNSQGLPGPISWPINNLVQLLLKVSGGRMDRLFWIWR
jgi:Zn-dependent protease